jgi:hypothetical protein
MTAIQEFKNIQQLDFNLLIQARKEMVEKRVKA